MRMSPMLSVPLSSLLHFRYWYFFKRLCIDHIQPYLVTQIRNRKRHLQAITLIMIIAFLFS